MTMPAAVAHWQKGLDTGSKADRVRLMGIGAAQRGSVYVPREDMLPIITDPVSFHVDAAPRTSRCSSASPCT